MSSSISVAKGIVRQAAPFGPRFGTGGRSSNSGITATVFGGNGFIGRYFVNELGACGSRVYVPFRGCELEVRPLKQMFDLGQVGLLPFSTRDRDSVAEAVKNSDVVINLIGKYYETKNILPTRRENGKLSRTNFSFEEVNVTIPETIAEVSAELGVKSLIHVSALAADHNSKSEWNRTKAKGEDVVRKKFPNAIIVKPATVFGQEDRFLNVIGTAMSQFEKFPLFDEGKSRLQPTYCGDVANALKEIIHAHQSLAGKDVYLAGLHEYTFKEVAEFVADVIERNVKLVDVPASQGKFAAQFLEHMFNPRITVDMIAQLEEDVVLPTNHEHLITYKDLGIEPTSMDKIAFEYLLRFRKGGHFTEVSGYH